MQSVKESSAAALSAVEFIFLDNPELKKYIQSLTKIDATIIASESVENAVSPSGVIIFSIELLISSTPIKRITTEIPMPATYSYLP